MSAHAKVLPLIAEGVARLVNARSVRLQHKADQLRHLKATSRSDGGHASYECHITDEVRTKLWSLCQTKIQAQPFARKCTWKKPNPPQEESTQQVDDALATSGLQGPQGAINLQEGLTSDIYVMGLDQQVTVYEPFSDSFLELSYVNEIETLHGHMVEYNELYIPSTEAVDHVDYRTPVTELSSQVMRHLDSDTLPATSNRVELLQPEDFTNDIHYTNYVIAAQSEELADEENLGYFYVDGLGNYFPVLQEGSQETFESNCLYTSRLTNTYRLPQIEEALMDEYV